MLFFIHRIRILFLPMIISTFFQFIVSVIFNRSLSDSSRRRWGGRVGGLPPIYLVFLFLSFLGLFLSLLGLLLSFLGLCLSFFESLPDLLGLGLSLLGLLVSSFLAFDLLTTKGSFLGLKVRSSLGLMLTDSLEKFVPQEIPESILDFRPETAVGGEFFTSLDGDLRSSFIGLLLVSRELDF